MPNALIIIARKDHARPPRQDFVVEPETGDMSVQGRLPERSIFVPPNKVIPVGRAVVLATGRQPFDFIAGAPSSGAGHQYFNALVARSEHILSYSLRSQSQLNSFTQQRYEDGTTDVNYLYPNDPDPRRKDASKITLRRDGTLVRSITNQVSIKQTRIDITPPGMTPGHTYLFCWDVWWGNEWQNENHQLDNHKVFQLPNTKYQNGTNVHITWEPHQSYNNVLAQGTPIATQWVRHYAEGLKIAGDGNPYPNYVPLGHYWGRPVGPNVTSGSGSFTPIRPWTEFVSMPETWTRHWMLFEYQMASDTIASYGGVSDALFQSTNGFASPQGTLASYWIADETREAVKIYDRLKITVWSPGFTDFWIEVNTSTNMANTVPSPSNLVAYMRNWVLLEDITYSEVPGLLSRPVN